jgi:DAACS family dicarboxylate/amino acid:cation (Na+ or H+) symporter
MTAGTKKKMSLPAKMGIGFALGIVLGFVFQMGGWDIAWIKPFGDLFIRLIRMIVVPLVFISLVAGAASMGDLSKLGRVSIKTITYYVGTTAVAVFIGLVIANLFQPGVGLNLATEGLKAREVSPPGAVQTFLNIVPLNPAQALAEGNLLQIIFFAIFFGFALSSLGEKGKPLLKIFEVGNEVMIRITGAVMQYAPYGVCALIAYTVGNSGMHVLLPLMKLIVLMYLAAVIHVRGVSAFPERCGRAFSEKFLQDYEPAPAHRLFHLLQCCGPARQPDRHGKTRCSENHFHLHHSPGYDHQHGWSSHLSGTCRCLCGPGLWH